MTQLRSLEALDTPADVAASVNDYNAAVLAFAAIQGTNASADDINAKVAAINAAADSVIRVCGLLRGG